MKNGKYKEGYITSYYKNDLIHREGGPAVEYGNGTKKWFINGKLHREDSPAIEYSDGEKEWWVNGKRHRIDGPAIYYVSAGDISEWYYNGNFINVKSQEEFQNFLKLKAFW